MLFATPAYMTDPQIERYARWWYQTVDNSGAIQAETQITGEIYTGFIGGDDDADGIPFISKADGRNGIAPLIAGRVLINVGAPGNESYAREKGQSHNPNQYSNVRMSYLPQTAEQQDTILLPLRNPKVPGLVAHEVMEREDGTLVPLQASKPIQIGLGTVLGLSGKQIFEANCALCHGQHGEGIDGLPFVDDIDRTHDAMFKIVNTGRFEQFMPPWGVGNSDRGGSTLTKPEIDKVIEYVQSDEFRDNFYALESGAVIPGSNPKDVWFYLSRENARAEGSKISNSDDARRYFAQQPDPGKLEIPSWEHILRTKPDAELTLSDRESLRQRLGLGDEPNEYLAVK